MKYHHYSQEQIDFLTELTLKGYTTKETAGIYNEKYFDDPITAGCVQSFRANHKIKSPNDGRFKKGNIPPNKGKHTKAVGRMVETQFKKGNIPPNHKPVGTITLRHDKTRRDYQYIKVAEPHTWKLLQVKVWEDHYGKVPDGCIVTFIDGDTMNCDIDNLMVISKKQNLVRNRNGYTAYDKDSAELMRNIIDLKIKVGEKKQELRKARRRV